MTDYLNIYFGQGTPAPRAVEWDRCLIVADGSPGLAESKFYELTADDWATQLIADGFSTIDRIYKSTSIFFGVEPSPERVFVYAYVSGTETTYEDVALEYVSGDTWKVPLSPVKEFKNDIELVNFYGYYDNYQENGYPNYSDGVTGQSFYVDTGVDGNWTGYLGFPNGLSMYGVTGEEVVVDATLPTSSKIYCDFTVGNESELGDFVAANRVNMIALALDNDKSTTQYVDNIFGDQLTDIMTIRSTISGKNCRWFYALPGNANPEDNIVGTTTKWKNLINIIGARDTFSAIKAFPSVDDDMAVGYMAMTAITHPHRQLTFAQPHMGIEKPEPNINKGKWNAGSIASIMQWTELAGNPYLITYGFTFGSGDFDRIEGSRCRIIILDSLYNNLYALLARRDTLTSYAGCQNIRKTIEATFNLLKSQRIVDGLQSIKIPIEEEFKKNSDAAKIARQQHLVPAVEIEYIWYTSVEKIIITRVENIAT